MQWLGKIFCGFVVACGAIIGAPQLRAQGLSPDWRQQAVQRIVSYLHVAGTDLVLATRAAGPVRPEGDRVMLRFTVDRSGQIRGVKIVKPSGFPKLDRLAQQLVGKAGPLPPLPASMGEQASIQLPIAFRQHGGHGQFFHAGQ